MDSDSSCRIRRLNTFYHLQQTAQSSAGGRRRQPEDMLGSVWRKEGGLRLQQALAIQTPTPQVATKEPYVRPPDRSSLQELKDAEYST